MWIKWLRSMELFISKTQTIAVFGIVENLHIVRRYANLCSHAL